MEGDSIVSRARFAFNSAAAKAEQALNDFKSDLRDSNEQIRNRKGSVSQSRDVSSSQDEQKCSTATKNSRWKPPTLGTKQEWHNRIRNIGHGRNKTDDVDKVENPKTSFPIDDDSLFRYNDSVHLEAKGLDIPSDCSDTGTKDIIPPSSVLKQLAVVVKLEKNYRSVKDFLTSSATSSPVRERASLGISAVKSLVLRGKDEKITPQCSNDDDVWYFIQAILDAEGLSPSRKVGFFIETLSGSLSVPREIHGAPAESLIVRVSEVIGSFTTLRKMAVFWGRLVAELRRLWLVQQYVPGIPHDEIPDLNYCLLYQQMQLINCCISRKKRRAIASSSLESLIIEACCDADGVPSSIENIISGSFPYAKTSTGNLFIRLGANRQADNLTILETGEPIYVPVTQEGPLLTEDLAQEAEEFVMRTGSVGTGCSQLLSDMQAFKAANPGCILEDFVRWHSPPDWTENESRIDFHANSDLSDSGSSRGRLSSRMQKEGNLWHELWATAKPVPAVRQAPIFDEELAVEGVLTTLEEISPSEIFGQLFMSFLGLGFVIAEARLSTDKNTAKLFYECKEYAVALCQGDSWREKIDDLCQVYETVEAIFVRPQDMAKMMMQPEDTPTHQEEPKHQLKKLTQIFGRKKQLRKSAPEEPKIAESSPPRRSFTDFFDSKSSIFSKKPPKSSTSPVDLNTLYSPEGDWTLV